MANAVIRQLKILMMLPRYPSKFTVSEIRERLAQTGIDRSHRTIERDLVALSAHFPIVTDETSIPGWSWSKDAKEALSTLSIDAPSALALCMVERHLFELLPQSMLRSLRPLFISAKRFLDSSGHIKSGLRNWSKRTALVQRGINPVPQQVDLRIARTVSEAIVNGQNIVIEYVKRFGDLKKSTLRPAGLLSRGNILYLAAFDVDGASQVKFFALHRFKKVMLTTTPSHIPTGFDLSHSVTHDGSFDIISSPDGERNIRVKLRFDPSAGSFFKDSVMYSNQSIEKKNGKYLVSFTAINSVELRWWILGFGEKVEVLAPMSLRTEISKSLTQAARHYRAKRA